MDTKELLKELFMDMKELFMGIRNFMSQHKVSAAIMAIVIFYTAFISPYIAIGMPGSHSTGGASLFLSIVLDKKEMKSVDRVVIQTAIKETEITNRKLIRMLVSETMTATDSGSNTFFRDNYIRLYHGDELVREMRQGSSSYLASVMVYKNDNKHFNILGSEEGWSGVMLSPKLLKRIEKALLEDGNFYPNGRYYREHLVPPKD